MSLLITPLILTLVFGSFVVSASVGLGGSLLMVPALVLAVGPKQGVALAALLLATNNVIKVVAYRRTIPWRAVSVVVVCTMLGAAFGARLLVHASSLAVGIAVLFTFVVSLAMERLELTPARMVASPVFALTAGATSGFSGTSGPLKGVAIRNLDFDRLHFVGAASFASFAGDATKVAIFANAQLLGTDAFVLALLALPLMAAGTALGRTLNGRVDEGRFAVLFWLVMTGYSIRLVTIVV